MATVLTATKVAGVSCLGPEIYVAVYTCLFDATDATGITTVDLTADFAYIHAIECCGNDTLADNGYKYDAVLPANGTAITSSNVAISVHEAAADGGTFDAVASTDLSAVGELGIIVWGKKA